MEKMQESIYRFRPRRPRSNKNKQIEMTNTINEIKRYSRRN